ncbi:MAG: SusD/RagB family nutrient-binding outer membrane lipoprotein [Salinivirgaceae bacterium]
MKTLKYITIVLLGVVMFTSCEVDYLGDPNQPEVAPTYGILNRVQKRFMDDTRDEWFSGRQMLLWVQYWNQVNYTEEDRFQYRETVNKTDWDDLYKNAQDLVDLINYNVDEATASDMAKYGSNETQIAAAQVMLVYIYLHAVELWGDVPYYSFGSTNETFQANQLKSNDNFQPAYAKQSDIYADMLTVLSKAQDVFEAATYVMDGDNFYDGAADQWQKFANSLRLRIANRIGDIANVNDAIADGVFTSNADNAGITYESTAVNGAPMYRAFVVSARNDFAPSMQLVELLKGNSTDFHTNQFPSDPRLAIYVQPNKNGDYVGIPLTDKNATVVSFKDESMPGAAVLAPDYTEIYMEYAEVCFILSEVNGWDQAWYEAGIRASMEKWGVAEADIAAYLAAVPAANEENVMMQKYIALYMQPMEAWSEYRRTGYPNSLVLAGSETNKYAYTWPATKSDGSVSDSTGFFFFDPIGITSVPNRNKYLNNEENINSANFEAAVASMGGNEQTTKLWWQP